MWYWFHCLYDSYYHDCNYIRQILGIVLYRHEYATYIDAIVWRLAYLYINSIVYCCYCCICVSYPIMNNCLIIYKSLLLYIICIIYNIVAIYLFFGGIILCKWLYIRHLYIIYVCFKIYVLCFCKLFYIKICIFFFVSC